MYQGKHSGFGPLPPNPMGQIMPPNASRDNEYPILSNVLYFNNLPTELSVDDFLKIVRPFGQILHSFCQIHNKFALITYEDGYSAKKAFQTLNRTKIQGRVISVTAPLQKIPGLNIQFPDFSLHLTLSPINQKGQLNIPKEVIKNALSQYGRIDWVYISGSHAFVQCPQFSTAHRIRQIGEIMIPCGVERLIFTVKSCPIDMILSIFQTHSQAIFSTNLGFQNDFQYSNPYMRDPSLQPPVYQPQNQPPMNQYHSQPYNQQNKYPQNRYYQQSYPAQQYQMQQQYQIPQRQYQQNAQHYPPNQQFQGSFYPQPPMPQPNQKYPTQPQYPAAQKQASLQTFQEKQPPPPSTPMQAAQQPPPKPAPQAPTSQHVTPAQLIQQFQQQKQQNSKQIPTKVEPKPAIQNRPTPQTKFQINTNQTNISHQMTFKPVPLPSPLKVDIPQNEPINPNMAKLMSTFTLYPF